MVHQRDNRRRFSLLLRFEVLATVLLAVLCTTAVQADNALPKPAITASAVVTATGATIAASQKAAPGGGLKIASAGGPNKAPPVPANNGAKVSTATRTRNVVVTPNGFAETTTNATAAANIGGRKLLQTACTVALVNKCKSGKAFQANVGYWAGSGWLTSGWWAIYKGSTVTFNAWDPIYIQTTSGLVGQNAIYYLCGSNNAYIYYHDVYANMYYSYSLTANTWSSSTSCQGIGGFWLGVYWRAYCNMQYIFEAC